jgi:mannitol/fructose-specific phosphotransferase system IIA component (Ntr-type)
VVDLSQENTRSILKPVRQLEAGAFCESISMEDTKGLLLNMIRVQELTFAQLEHEAVDTRLGIKEIRSSIDLALQKIPKEWGRIIQRLQGGGQPAVVPVTHGFCSFCRIQLPTALAQEIRRQSRIHQCPCCARILYFPEGGGLRMEIDSSRLGRGGIARFSSPKLIVPNLQSTSRDGVLEEMVHVLAREGWVDRPDDVLRAAIEREDLVSTAIDHSLAFPHVRGVEGVGLIFAVGLKKKGLHFGALGGRLTRLVFFSLIPQAASGFYLKIISGLVRTFRQDEARNRLLSHDSSEGIWETLLAMTADVIS